ncbi:MAG: WG repeat-containing protein [Clostridium sp.]|nr:WG repeat-containing protein [Clostridium sp.]MCM1443748.1 WG repeat-containing protein [Candidatus Amulumruptor caecigallinarius]
MKCLKCNAENEKTSKFCINCGVRLKPEKRRRLRIVKIRQISAIALLTFMVILLGFIIKMIIGGKSNYLEQIYNINNPIVIEKKGLYGYIDAKGNILLEPTYLSATQFYGDFAVVGIEDKTNPLGTKYQIINKKGKKILESQYSTNIKYIDDYRIWIVDNKLYNSKLKQLTKDDYIVYYEDYGYLTYINSKMNEVGIINFDGKIIFKQKNSDESTIDIEISKTDLEEHYAKICIRGETDKIISLQTGKIIYENEEKNSEILVKDDNIFIINNNPKSNLYLKDEKVMYRLDKNINEMSLYSDDILKIDYGYKYSSYGLTQRYYYHNFITGEVLKEEPLEGNLKKVLNIYTEYNCLDKIGLKENEKIILPCEYDKILYLPSDLYNYLNITKSLKLIITKKDGNIELKDIKSLKTLYIFENDSINTYNESTFIKVKSDNNILIYNLYTGLYKTFDIKKEIDIYPNYIKVTKDKTVEYYNTSLEKIYEIEE